MKKINLIVLLLLSLWAAAQTNFDSGTYIVNMGVYTSNKTNDVKTQLKPYGMIYELMKSYNVPVYWVIGQGKAKDGKDFSYNGTDYKGGTFIISSKYITQTVKNRITYWEGQGVVGIYTTGSLTLTTTYKLTSAPNWTLNDENQDLVKPFWTNAGIPSSSYNTGKAPSQLTDCDDIFVMPHADPTWANHYYLINWNANKGAIWAGCHAVNVLENLYSGSQQMNFLTTAGIGKQGDAQNNSFVNTNGTSSSSFTVPDYPLLVSASDPIAQYMGATDSSHKNGSGQVYFPVSSTVDGYRSTTNIIVYDPNDSRKTTTSSSSKTSGNLAAYIAYGRGYGNTGNGWVMYEGGHNLNKETIGDVPAQRAFWNFSFLAAYDKSPQLGSVSGVGDNNAYFSNTNYNFSASGSSPMASTLTYTWSAVKKSDGSSFGTFTPNGTTAASSTTFNAGSAAAETDAIITVKIKDACGRENFESYEVKISPAIIAKNDDFSATPINGYTGGSTGSVFADNGNGTDMAKGNPASGSNVSVSLTNNGGVTGTTIDSNGIISVPAGTAPGTYTLTYQICLLSDNTVCATAIATIVVIKGDCFKSAAGGTPDGYTKIGITIQQKQSGWPENIPNGFITLESKEKGMVITRVAHVSSTPDLTNDSIKDPKEGMLVYDIQDKCVKLFNGIIWRCISECGK
ncbi:MULTISPECIES: carboxypeptidase-like regulatory domain-containing protein [Empedobacter]|uniref:carboxypeptidase-like regulatory domain-containing protein n=1 Tax=Empedobacter TaxID=59734 RepID=UPI002575D485|nr:MULTISPECIES: hypothetical protein [Empedobacter]MDM1042742.1 carboxypeptidase regulatory-like domain-containing protein [Empedobacter brevis]MDM1136672.1 carboxypeptidase regulatory-like domain-containing protein [Empedobacter sp. R750]